MYIFDSLHFAHPNVKPRMWDTLGLYLCDVGGPYSRLAKMRAGEVKIAVVEEALKMLCVKRRELGGGGVKRFIFSVFCGC